MINVPISKLAKIVSSNACCLLYIHMLVKVSEVVEQSVPACARGLACCRGAIILFTINVQLQVCKDISTQELLNALVHLDLRSDSQESVKFCMEHLEMQTCSVGMQPNAGEHNIYSSSQPGQQALMSFVCFQRHCGGQHRQPIPLHLQPAFGCSIWQTMTIHPDICYRPMSIAITWERWLAGDGLATGYRSASLAKPLYHLVPQHLICAVVCLQREMRTPSSLMPGRRRAS